MIVVGEDSMSLRTDLGDINTATRQADQDRDTKGRFTKGNQPKAGFHTNPERRSNGHWKKSESARYKLEKMMTLTEAELQAILDDPESPQFEQKIADAIMEGSWPTLRDMMNQVYGLPRSSVEINTDSTEPLIKGFVIPTLPEGFINLSTNS